MNVESTSTNITTTTTTKKSDTTTSSTSTTNPTQDTKASFKDELNSAKTQDAKSTEQNKAQETQTEENAQNVQNNPNTEAEQNAQNIKAAEQNNIKQLEKEKLESEQNKTASDTENTLFAKSYNELNSQIAALNDIKNNSLNKTQSVNSKNDEMKTDSTKYCATIKMDNNDISFYLNLVDNQQMSAQSGQANNNINQFANNFTEVKSEATQKTVQVSATLLDALNEAAKTNKPFRIDFDSDVAVIMKVDKNGVLSANFIPGSAAVEQYLRNNIDGLRQSFNDQNLPYNQLTYSNREKQNQQEKQSKNQNKENNNE